MGETVINLIETELTEVNVFGIDLTLLAEINWVAIDRDGSLYAYDERPTPSADIWLGTGDLAISIGKVEFPEDTDWKTLVQSV